MQRKFYKMSKRFYFVLILLVLVLAAGWMLLKPQMAPNIQFTTIDGQKLQLTDLRGKVVLVHFWATSCTTCIQEMPELIRFYKNHQAQGLELIAFAMSYDPPNYVLNYAQSRQLPFKVSLDANGDIAQAFSEVNATPTTFVIDSQGRIVKRYVGIPVWSELAKQFAQLSSV